MTTSLSAARNADALTKASIHPSPTGRWLEVRSLLQDLR